MILLMGIKTSFTKNPTNPITTNPIAVLTATLVNSATQRERSISKSQVEKKIAHKDFKDRIKREGDSNRSILFLPFRSGLWHLFTRRTLSLANSLKGSTTESTASIFQIQFEEKEQNPRSESRWKRRWQRQDSFHGQCWFL